MEKYPLQSLLDVRKYREQNAQNAVRQAENLYKECVSSCMEQQKKIAEYAKWKVQEEERKYTEILGSQLHIDDLEDFKQYFAYLKDKGVKLEEELYTLEKQKENAKQTVEQKKEEFKLAKKNTTKIEAHHDIWKQAEKKEQERKEDLEAEEFKPLSPIGTENSE